MIRAAAAAVVLPAAPPHSRQPAAFPPMPSSTRSRCRTLTAAAFMLAVAIRSPDAQERLIPAVARAVPAARATPLLKRRVPPEVYRTPLAAELRAIAAAGVQAGVYPGATILVGTHDRLLGAAAVGALGWPEEGTPAAGVRPSVDDTRYDLASLTKVLATSLLTFRLIDQGVLDLDSRAGEFLPEYAEAPKDQVTIRHLLTHTAGLQAGRELWRHHLSPDDTRALVLDTPLERAPGAAVEYSDIGMDVLGLVVEAAAGAPLDVLMVQEIAGPLGLTTTGFRPSPEVQRLVAPTEMRPPRGYPLQGEVHDENAYALGGVAGHAGLFASAADVARLAQMLLNAGELDGIRVLTPESAALFLGGIRVRARKGSRGLGWEWCTEATICGDAESAEVSAVFHTGYTGTFLLIDPETDRFVVFLTNRVHQPRHPRSMTALAVLRTAMVEAALDRTPTRVLAAIRAGTDAVSLLQTETRRAEVSVKRTRAARITAARRRQLATLAKRQGAVRKHARPTKTLPRRRAGHHATGAKSRKKHAARPTPHTVAHPKRRGGAP